jgi:hypothetical protein
LTPILTSSSDAAGDYWAAIILICRGPFITTSPTAIDFADIATNTAGIVLTDKAAETD